jgi:hypothetical protein
MAHDAERHGYPDRVTTEPRAFLTQDSGGATNAVALIGHVGGRWRLIGSLALPAGADRDALAALLVERAATADPELAAALGLDRTPIADLPWVDVASRRPPRLAVVAGSERALAALVAAASRSGWATTAASAETTDPLEMSTLLLDPGIQGILVGAADPPAADERRALGELGALVAAVASRRREIPVIVAGGMAAELHAFGDVADRPAHVLTGVAAMTGPKGAPLRELLIEVALPFNDARRALGAAATALAEILDRRIDIVEIGFDGGTRAAAWPGASGGPAELDLAIVPSAALAPADPDDHVVDRVATWSTWTSDRHRLRDRLRELRIAPWADAAGEGTALRMAAARAALSSLDRWTPEWSDRQAADLVVATGGPWAVTGGPSVALALSDVLRRAGATQFALDHARLLAPLGSIPDPGERRQMLADLADDLLAPLGTVVTPAGLRQGKPVGEVHLHGETGGSRGHDLRSGGIEVLDLRPGATAVAEFRFHDTVRLGGRGRHFAIDVTGGLGGLLVDLRDVPLRLPERADLRGELLESWQATVRNGAGS